MTSVEEIQDSTAKDTIGVYGLGYVGLPLVFAFVDKGFRVLGFDIDESKIDALRAGKSYMKHIPDASVEQVNAFGRFELTRGSGTTSRC
jgi:UDP-N-acetyl-D-glucosamine dehydrogenase